MASASMRPAHSSSLVACCLQVHPIFHNDELVLHIAQLFDYSHRLSRLVTHKPIQFCMADEHFQRSIPLTEIADASHLRRPCRIVLNGNHLQTDQSGGEEIVQFVEDTGSPDTLKLPTLHVKRLGFFRLALEPMYLIDRMVDEFEQLDMPCHVCTSCAGDGEVHRLDVSSSAEGTHGRVSAAVHVMPEDAYGRYCITMTRLQGDTFGYHSLYRTLRQKLVDLQDSN